MARSVDAVLSPLLIQDRERLREQFHAATPFPHVVIDQFLRPESCQALLSQFPAYDDARFRNERGDRGKAHFENLRDMGPAFAAFDSMVQSRDFLRFMSDVSGIPDLIFDPDYFGGGTHENLEDMELDPHVDFTKHPTTGLYRRLNLLLYLNPVWQEQWGGALELHTNPWEPSKDVVKAVLPLFNRCVLFATSHRSWHGFRALRGAPDAPISRKSIALYLYTQRPNEGAPFIPHDLTVFVDRPLPRYFDVGRSLTAADVDLVHRLLVRRDMKLHHLYDRAIALSNDVARLETALKQGDVNSCDAPVDIVIPIFNARAHVLRCLASVQRYATGDWRLILVNDASTDPLLIIELQRLAAADERVVYLANAENQGFTHTANRGMQLHAGRDVLLLNSDTEVFAGFLDGLRRAAYTDQATGIVGPLSNNATHCSVPEWLKDNPIPEGWTAETMAALVAATSRRERPEMVTAVGFCMYVRGRVLDDVGYFDEQTFGRGYCEEIDLCERAKQFGYSIRLADDVFVWHAGKASFGDEGRARQTENFKLLEPKHPHHVPDYLQFIEDNPFAGIQNDLRFYLQRAGRNAPAAVLHLFATDPFAATDLTAAAQIRLIASAGASRSLVAFPRASSVIVAEIFDGAIADRYEYGFPLSHPAVSACVRHAEIDQLLSDWLRLFDVAALHAHQLQHWPVESVEAMTARMPVFVDFDNYYPLCAGGYLFDEASSDACDRQACRCSTTGLSGDQSEALRARHAHVFAKLLPCAHLVFPSEYARAFVSGRCDLSRATLHVLEPHYPRRAFDRLPARSGPLRLAVVGDVSRAALGRDHYEALFSATSDTPVEWHLFSAPSTDQPLGARRRVQARSGLLQLGMTGVDAVVSLPAWSEPYSHPLSLALSAGLPAIVNDRGEAASRLRRHAAGAVVSSVEEAAAVIARLAHNRHEVDALTARARAYMPQRAAGLDELYAGALPRSEEDMRSTAEQLQELADRLVRRR